MNLKGIKITKKMYKRISNIGVSNIKLSTLQGLDEFKKFTWSGFIKQEFAALIKCMDYFEEKELLNNIDDSQLFVFNYYTDVTEMDIATVLTDKEKKNIIVDIEYKSGDKAEEKLDEQIVKRTKDHMKQLFLNEKYIVIAMTDNGFYKANYYDSETNIDIIKLEEVIELFNSFTNNNYVEALLTQANDLAGIHSLYSQMENGELRYYEETKKTTEFILDKINKGKKAVVCLSKPGTGKTVIAFKLFFENENTRFLIMNQKFYNALGLTKYFVKGRCFFGSNTFLNQDLSDKIVIIDEVQRLNKEKILEIINASKATILFGDASQSFMVEDLDLDGHKLIPYLSENGVYVCNKELKRSKRYNESVEKALNYLSSRSEQLKENIVLEDYKIKLYYDSKEFLNSYHYCMGGKKMFTTYDYKDDSSLIIGDETFYIARGDFYNFSISIGPEYYLGHTLHAISFDVENNYIYLKNVCVVNKNNKDFLAKKDSDYNDEEQIRKFLNELNILFTRGKKSLNIYTEDIEVYLLLNKKLKNVYQK